MLGGLPSHPSLGLEPRKDTPSRATLLAAGALERDAAAALLLASLAEAAVGMVWGVGPWEHDFSSLAAEPPPDAIATAVALSAVARDKPPTAGNPMAAAAAAAAAATAAAELPLRAPLCLDVSPAALRRLLAVLAEALQRALHLASLEGTLQQSAALYSCLALLRLAKVVV